MKKFVLSIFLATSTFLTAASQSPSLGKEAVSKPSTQEVVSNEQVQTKIDTFLNSLEKRLVLMHEVAKWKWNQGAPIEDPEREKAILSQMKEKAKAYGLDPAFVELLFKEQINAAKEVQIHDFEKWLTDGTTKHSNSKDLQAELRSQIDEINNDILVNLKAILPLIHETQFQNMLKNRASSIITGDGIDTSVRDAVIAPIIAQQKH